MKYKAHEEVAGTWFVNTYKKGGKQFGKRFDNELEAKQQAILFSFEYHHKQMDDAFTALEAIAETNQYGEIKLIGEECFGSQGDYMC